ncbi:unnamed protein product, partial [Allacma fusca]
LIGYAGGPSIGYASPALGHYQGYGGPALGLATKSVGYASPVSAAYGAPVSA